MHQQQPFSFVTYVRNPAHARRRRGRALNERLPAPDWRAHLGVLQDEHGLSEHAAAWCAEHGYRTLGQLRKAALAGHLRSHPRTAERVRDPFQSSEMVRRGHSVAPSFVGLTDRHTMMHQISITALFLLLSALASKGHAQVFADDAEPNNTLATALPLALGAAYEGRLDMGAGDGFDLYSVVVPDGGHLEFTIEGEQSGTGGLPLIIHPLEVDSAQGMSVAVGVLGDQGLVVTTVTRLLCLGAGAQYLQVSRSPGDACSYRLTAQFVPLAFAGDPEPNEDIASATPLAEAVDATGHLSVGWPYSGASPADVWRLDKTSVGPLTLMTAFATDDPVADDFVVVELMDQAGTSISAGNHTVEVGLGGAIAEDTLVVYGIMDQPGTYYLRFAYTASICTAYRLHWASGALGVQEAQLPAMVATMSTGHLSLMSTESGPFVLSILDASGRLVLPARTFSAFPCSVDLGAMASGAYLAQVRLAGGRSLTARIAVQR